MKSIKFIGFMVALLVAPSVVSAATYQIDTEGQHAFIEFRVNHLGYSWLYGRFNDFSGQFQFDPDNPGDASVNVTIDPASVDTNHAERDRHIRSDDFLHVDEYSEASFTSTASELNAEGHGTVTGDLTLHGTTREVTLDVEHVGAGEDPWGGFRRGFIGTTTIDMREFGIDEDGMLGPAGRNVELTLSVEGIRQ